MYSSTILRFAQVCPLILMLSFSIAGSMVDASSVTVVKVEPQTVSADLHQAFNVSIIVADIQDLYGFEITLNWDPTILRVVKVDNRIGVEDYPGGILHKPVIIPRDNVSQDQGLYLVLAASVNPAGSFNGTGTVAVLTFNVTSVGTCTLFLDAELASKARQNQSQPIDHQTENGYFGGQIPEFPSFLIVPLIMSSTSLAVLLHKRKKR